jgi:glutaredoxin
VNVRFYSSAFCDPCISTRAVLDEVSRLVPTATIEELDVARYEARAAADGIRMTPTIVISDADDSEVFRAEGAPTLNQVLVALAKAV